MHHQEKKVLLNKVKSMKKNFSTYTLSKEDLVSIAFILEKLLKEVETEEINAK